MTTFRRGAKDVAGRGEMQAVAEVVRKKKKEGSMEKLGVGDGIWWDGERWEDGTRRCAKGAGTGDGVDSSTLVVCRKMQKEEAPG